MVVGQVDRSGINFFDTGKAIEDELGKFSRELTGRNSKFDLLDPGYRGQSLGLASLAPVHERDGIRRLLMRSSGSAADRTAAAAEWTQYLAGFEAIERVNGFNLFEDTSTLVYRGRAISLNVQARKPAAYRTDV